MKLFNFVRSILMGVSSVLSVTSSPLYRYPYRNTHEGLAADFKHIGKDIEMALQRGEDDYG